MTSSKPVRLFQPTHSVEMEEALLDVLRSGQIASGPKVAAFEEALGALIERPHVVTTSDMTSALVLALHLAGVRPGDEVVTMAFSCMSSNSPIAQLGATAVWVDMDPETASMSVADFERALSPRTRAAMLYHVAGYPGPSADIAALCRDRGIVLIEDCNNALGASVKGDPIGGHGDFAVYSFYPNRQINALEGGALRCPDADTAQAARRLRRFGIDGATFRDPLGEINPASDIPQVGWSASLNQVNAAVGLTQVAGLSAKLAQTRARVLQLQALLQGVRGLRWVTPLDGAVPAYWGALARVEQRDAVLARLKSAGVQASRLHQRNDGYSGFHSAQRALPGTDAFTSTMLALPCGHWLDEADIDAMASTLKAALNDLA